MTNRISLLLLSMIILGSAYFVTATARQVGGHKLYGDIEIVVHRGANHIAPENTVASAFAALRNGATWIEVDVRRSKDSVLFNMHDPTLNRTTNGTGYIAECSSEYIKSLDAGSWFAKDYVGTRVPTIAEMLDSLRGKAQVFFDVKSGTPIPQLVSMVRQKGFADKSFFWFGDSVMLNEFIKLAPDMKIKVNVSDVAGIKRWMRVCKPSYIEIDARNITDSVRNFCHSNGIRIMAAIQGSGADAYREALERHPDLVNLDRPELFIQIRDSMELADEIKRHPLSVYVDPMIGSEGLGRVFVGPSYPFGMAKPSPDCTVNSNSGWLPMPAPVNGFSQVHVSGTGGGPKYGNILVQPFCGDTTAISHTALRESEIAKLGYYSTTFANSHIKTEITSARRTSFYRFTYPYALDNKSLAIDAGFFLGESPIPDSREAQQFVGSQIHVVSNNEVEGYSKVRGGWNNGRAYTVYFYAICDKPFLSFRTWKGKKLNNDAVQVDTGEKTGALLTFNDVDTVVQMKVGISFVSEQKARQNCMDDCNGWAFDGVREGLVNQWEHLLHKMKISDDEPLRSKRMFYTALYHTMLMPTDRTGDNPLWIGDAPYYDDFYAIWDTYRTSLPLITLVDQEREVGIVRSLIDIYRREGYMPDARSGNCNGRTQGGSNAEIVIADARAKGLVGIDYEMGLKAMLNDATVPPGGNQEAEGRGGLAEYLSLGYIPYGIPRAGNRTVEYAFCDWAIAKVAQSLGKNDIARQYMLQSANWKNLWRGDYTEDGVSGFVMPRTAEGQWLDSLPYGHSKIQKPTFAYTATTREGPWYTPWWNTFFYEGTSWEYSFSVPHDVPGLIKLCGGKDAFVKRLDCFFDHGYFNVANEPSFLTPCLYNWVDMPWRSADRVRAIVDNSYSDKPDGLPGNDDSGAMSSWLAFHMMGLYPNAGHNYYLIVAPMVSKTVMRPRHGISFTIVADGLSARNRYIQEVWLNGQPYHCSTLAHADILKGGTLVLKMGKTPKNNLKMNLEE